MKKSRKRNQSYPHARQRRQARPQRAATPQRYADTGQGYASRVLAAAASGGIVKPGTVTEVCILHDDGCRRPYGGACSCRPEITARDEAGRVHVIDEAGEVTSRTRLN